MSDVATVQPTSDLEVLSKENARLRKMVQVLMDRAQRLTDPQASDFGHLQKTVLLDTEVRARTRELEAAHQKDERITRELRLAQENMAREIRERKAVQAALELEREAQRALIKELEVANSRVLQSEKLASIGQLAAGVAHEINNPISFVASNLDTLRGYVAAMGHVLDAYADAEASITEASGARARIEVAKKTADLEYLRQDINALIAESLDGAQRVRKIVQDLRDFSRVGSTEWSPADIHTIIESTLSVVRNEIKYKADVVKEFGDVPPVECNSSQISQVILNLLVNAAQSIKEHGTITLRTGIEEDWAWMQVSDTGGGIEPDLLPRIFDPFFTTKSVGEGTGLGLSVSYGIIQKHSGRIEVTSTVGVGTAFTIHLPLTRS